MSKLGAVSVIFALLWVVDDLYLRFWEAEKQVVKKVQPADLPRVKNIALDRDIVESLNDHIEKYYQREDLTLPGELVDDAAIGFRDGNTVLRAGGVDLRLKAVLQELKDDSNKFYALVESKNPQDGTIIIDRYHKNDALYGLKVAEIDKASIMLVSQPEVSDQTLTLYMYQREEIEKE